MKRLFDICFSAVLLVVLSPVLVIIMVLIWAHDFHSPFYRANRVGKGEELFRMLKFRTMIVNADRTGVTSTAGDDPRITPIGRFIRRFKLDELIQFVNVFTSDMSIVGPRPNVPSGTALYTREEKRLLTVKPGITDFASIVFSDEAEILRGYPDPDAAYDRLIRPWKSRLGLFYIDHASMWVDIMLVFLTIVSVISRPRALAGVERLLGRLGAPADLIHISGRSSPLISESFVASSEAESSSASGQ